MVKIAETPPKIIPSSEENFEEGDRYRAINRGDSATKPRVGFPYCRISLGRAILKDIAASNDKIIRCIFIVK